MKPFIEETRALRDQIVDSSHQVHYISQAKEKSLGVNLISGVAFIDAQRGIGVEVIGSIIPTLLKIRIGDTAQIKAKVSEKPYYYESESYGNEKGDEEFSTLDIELREIPAEGEVYCRVPLFIQRTHPNPNWQEWWLELTYTMMGPDIDLAPLRLCWSIYRKESLKQHEG